MNKSRRGGAYKALLKLAIDVLEKYLTDEYMKESVYIKKDDHPQARLMEMREAKRDLINQLDILRNPWGK